VIEPLRLLAEALSGEPLRVAEARWLRLTAGSYSLLKDSRGPTAESIEIILDASAGEHEAAAIAYVRAGEPHRVFGHQRLSLIAFDRRPRAHRFDRYLPLTAGPAEVYRLRLALLPAP
jgi:hypothetical protein